MKTFNAIYENGVFRPTEAVDLPESTPVVVQTQGENLAADKTQGDDGPSKMTPGLARIYEILGERYSSGFPDTAQRHNEHQP